MTGFGLLTFQAAATGWLSLLLIAIVAAVVALVVGRGRTRRARTDARTEPRAAQPPVAEPVAEPAASPATATPQARPAPPARSGGGLPPWQQVLDGLATAVAPDPSAPSADADRLGLRSRVARADAAGAEPTVYWGVRSTSQVFIRLGVGEQSEGSSHASAGGRLECTVIRAAFPSFRLRGEGGSIRTDGGQVPAAVRAVLEGLATAPDVWERLLVTAGPDGIVAVRPQADAAAHDWVHDLWLLEQLAAAAIADPLPAARVGPAWRVPYGMARR